MKINSYRDLIVWQKAMELVKRTYAIIAILPKEEKYALADQMRRCVVSIPSNIAEGYERNSSKEYIHFLSIANGSKAELITQLEICKMLGYANEVSPVIALCDEIGKMIYSIIKKIGEKEAGSRS